ncbi:uncharacterized protein LOC123680830 [Harmonia axyridis]|uniref:uncharacterized protein LOC123680830 n=1 Tax=Harmonia axyridis TaxID=115357 RepID=UPI001E276F4A|nr:uncharacterized protein LOC123680830 [Harmonia axyridis]
MHTRDYRDWKKFSKNLKLRITKISQIDTPEELEDRVNDLEEHILKAYEESTKKVIKPTPRHKEGKNPIEIKELIKINRRLTKNYRIYKKNEDRLKLNKHSQVLKNALIELWRIRWNKKISELNTKDHSAWIMQKYLRQENTVIPPLHADTIERASRINYREDDDNEELEEIIEEHEEEMKTLPEETMTNQTSPTEIKELIRKLFQIGHVLQKSLIGCRTINWVRRDECSKQLLKHLKQCLRESYTKQKQKYNSEFISGAENKSRAVWKVIKRETGRRGTGAGQSQLSSDDMAGSFSDIGDSGNQILHGSDADPSILFKNYMSRKKINDHSMFIFPTDVSELQSIVKGLKGKLTQDIYGMNTLLLKKNLKMARVVPLHKKGDADYADNYRPISILPVFSKILEELLKRRLIAFSKSKNVLSEDQHGFSSGKSTTTTL